MRHLRNCLLGLLALLAYAAPALADGNAAAGKEQFQKTCRACHLRSPGKNGVGPSLFAVTGRAAGTVDGYRYSEALRSSGLTWDEATLLKWLANPQALVPGNKMPFSLKDPQTRADVVAYLLYGEEAAEREALAAERRAAEEAERERQAAQRQRDADEKRFGSTLAGSDPQQMYLAAVQYEANGERGRAKRVYSAIMGRFSSSTLAIKAADRLARIGDIEAVESVQSRTASEINQAADRVEKGRRDQCMAALDACYRSCSGLSWSQSQDCERGCTLCP